MEGPGGSSAGKRETGRTIRNGRAEMREWRRGILGVVFWAALLGLASCGRTPEVPQGEVTGIWQGTVSIDNSYGNAADSWTQNLWLEQQPDNTVREMTDPDRFAGRYAAGAAQLTLTFFERSYDNLVVFRYTNFVGTRSGDTISGTVTVRRGADNSVVATGSAAYRYVMDPADLTSSFPVTYGGYTDFSRGWQYWANPLDNADASLSGGGISPMVPGMVFRVGKASRNDFLMNANIGCGRMSPSLENYYPGMYSVSLGEGGQALVPTAEGRYALVRYSSTSPYGYASSSYEFVAPVSDLAVAGDYAYVQRRLYGNDAAGSLRVFVGLRDPGTRASVDPLRVDTTSLRMFDSNGRTVPLRAGSVNVSRSEICSSKAALNLGTTPLPTQILFPPVSGVDNLLNATRVGPAAQLDVPANLPAGWYGFTVNALDNGATRYRFASVPVYFDNGVSSPGPVPVDNMSSTLLTDGGIRFDWVYPHVPPSPTTMGSGVLFTLEVENTVDRTSASYRVALSASLPAVMGIPGSPYSLTVPATAVAGVRARFGTTPLQWTVQLRCVSSGFEILRHYSDPKPLALN
jgi:hypothetical protein